MRKKDKRDLIITLFIVWVLIIIIINIRLFIQLNSMDYGIASQNKIIITESTLALITLALNIFVKAIKS